jgi:hypothetical protein
MLNQSLAYRATARTRRKWWRCVEPREEFEGADRLGSGQRLTSQGSGRGEQAKRDRSMCTLASSAVEGWPLRCLVPGTVLPDKSEGVCGRESGWRKAESQQTMTLRSNSTVWLSTAGCSGTSKCRVQKVKKNAMQRRSTPPRITRPKRKLEGRFIKWRMGMTIQSEEEKKKKKKKSTRMRVCMHVPKSRDEGKRK